MRGGHQTMKTIKIKKSTDADSRTAKGELSKKKLEKASLQHIRDVEVGMLFFASLIRDAGRKHDFTKITHLDEFWEDYKQGLADEEFKKADWYQTHINKERHHLNSNIPHDVNLVDVLEMIVDCIMAGHARFGEVNPSFLELSPDLLEKAYWNTIYLLNGNLLIEED